MNIQLYIDRAIRTEKRPFFELPVDIHVYGQILLSKPTMPGIIGDMKVRLLHSGLGMATEIAELQQAIDAGDRVNILEELGDILWYWAIALDALQFRDFSDEGEETLVFSPTEAERRLTARICAWADLVRRDSIHAKPMRPEMALAVLCEVWRGVGDVCRAFRLDRARVMDRNIEKLRTRFPAQYDGVQFEERDLSAEREILEGLEPEVKGSPSNGLALPRKYTDPGRVADRAVLESCTCTYEVGSGDKKTFTVTCRVHGAQQDSVEAAFSQLFSLSPDERLRLRVSHQNVECYLANGNGAPVFVAVVDLEARCICIGLPPAPGKRGYCPKHPDR